MLFMPDKSKRKNNFKDYITYFVIMLCDVILVIYCACNNKVQYVKLFGKDIFVGNTKDMLFGKNFINIIITIFVYFYLLAIRKVFLHKKNTKKIFIFLFCGVSLLNLLLFYFFTKRIY